MSRYTGWHQRRGAVEASAVARDLGRRLLGEIENAQRLGGPAIMVRQRTADDGTVVEARIAHGIPSVTFGPAPAAGTSAGKGTFLSGLVVAPRTYASATAFGAHAETVLVPFRTGSPTETWRSYYFDATYVPVDGGGLYGTTPQKRPLFEDGLEYGGNLDWRSADEFLTVSWIGPASRYFPENGNFAPWVFYNGDVLFDATQLPNYALNTRTVVVSAALRTTARKAWLLVITYERRGSNHYFRGYRFPVVPSTTKDLWYPRTGGPDWQAPRLQPIDATAAAPVMEQSVPALQSYLYVVPWHFNQSANEARVILPLYTTGPVRSTITEFVVDCSNLDAWTVSSTAHAEVRRLKQQTQDFSPTGVAANQGIVYNLAKSLLLDFDETNVDGSGNYLDVAQIGRRDGQQCLTRPSTPPFVWLGAMNCDTTVSDEDTADDYPIAVDFADDVPVYAYMKRRSLAGTIKRRSSVTNDITVSASGYLRAAASGTPGHIDWHREAAADVSATADVALDYDIGGVFPGIRCPLPEGGNWLDLQGSVAEAVDVTASSSFTGSMSYSFTDTDIVDPGVYADPDASATGDSSDSVSITRDYTTVSVSLWHLDLRYRAAVYSLTTQRSVVTDTTEHAATITDWNGGSATFSGTGRDTTVSHSQLNQASYVTRAVFLGAQVAEYTCTPADVSSSSGPTTTTNGSYLTADSSGAIDTLGWAALKTSVLTTAKYADQVYFTDTAAQTAWSAFEATLPAPTTGPWAPGTVDSILPALDDYPDYSPAEFSDVASDGYGYDIKDNTYGVVKLSGATWATGTIAALYGGRYQSYRGGWCYSMAKIAGADPTVRQWDSLISSGQSLDTLTGSHHPDLLGDIWPLSRCPFITPGP